MSLNRLQVVNVTKIYPGCIANQDINLTIQPGEIHALLGENGAGKSTLMKIIYGLVCPDTGEIIWEGQKVSLNNVSDARSLGVGMVLQHFSLFDTLTVTENIALALPNADKGAKWSLSQVDRKIRILSQEYGLNINPDRPVYTLSVGEKQRVEIIRCLLQDLKLLILDEPTAVLTAKETLKLFVILRQIAANGCSLLFSTHKLDEVRALCSRATILRQGRVVASLDPQTETSAALARMMVGEDLSQSHLNQNQRRPDIPSSVSLEVRDLSLPKQHQFDTPLENINLTLHAGEIVGIAGVAGNGQDSLLAALSGEVLCPQPNMIMLGAMPIGNLGVTTRRRLGLGYVPAERLGKAVVPNFNLLDNALLTAYGQGLLRRGVIRQRKLKAWTSRICDAINVKNAGLHVQIGSLSGGNVQKFIMGREINQNPAVLIAAHPTWGVDIKATVTIHEALRDMRASGASVLIISEDLDELFTLCDSVGAIYKGRLSQIKPITQVTRNQIGQLMAGIGIN